MNIVFDNSLQINKYFEVYPSFTFACLVNASRGTQLLSQTESINSREQVLIYSRKIRAIRKRFSAYSTMPKDTAFVCSSSRCSCVCVVVCKSFFSFLLFVTTHFCIQASRRSTDTANTNNNTTVQAKTQIWTE